MLSHTGLWRASLDLRAIAKYKTYNISNDSGPRRKYGIFFHGGTEKKYWGKQKENDKLQGFRRFSPCPMSSYSLLRPSVVSPTFYRAHRTRRTDIPVRSKPLFFNHGSPPSSRIGRDDSWRPNIEMNVSRKWRGTILLWLDPINKYASQQSKIDQMNFNHPLTTFARGHRDTRRVRGKCISL